MSELFSEDGTNEYYERVRNPSAWLPTIKDYEKASPKIRKEKLDNYLSIQGRMEEAWKTFEASAENNFLDNLRKNFWPGWFELYLQHILIDCGLENKATNGEGEPDYIVHNSGQHVFDIEATILTMGVGASSAPQFPAPTSEVQVYDVSDTISNIAPNGEIPSGGIKQTRNPNAQSDYCLRITTTLDAKLKQIQRWKAKGYDPSAIPVVVAISTANIEYNSNGMVTDSHFERVLYGKGDLAIPISDKQLQFGRAYHEKKPTMHSKSGAEIQLSLFDKSEYRDISAVGYFPDWFHQYREQMPIFFLNPNAYVPIPIDKLPVGQYRTFEGDVIKVVSDYQ